MLSAKGLQIGYEAAFPLFEALNISLLPQHLTVLLGANGVGKSTLLRTLAGLQRSRAGKVYWAGKELMSFLPTALAQNISLVLTHRPQDAYITVAEALALGRFPYMRWYEPMQTRDKARIEEALLLTDTVDLRQKRLATLSDGQLQKVMIARALVQDTPVILLDEPTAHLDLANRFMIFELLQRLAHQSAKTLLVATHDIEPALQTADEVWLLHNGKCLVEIPEMLVLKGVLSEAFGSDRLQYDAKKGVFNIQKPPIAYLHLTYTEYELVGIQTQKALERIGFQIAKDATEKISILSTSTTAGYMWEWAGKGFFEDLRELLEKLQMYHKT